LESLWSNTFNKPKNFKNVIPKPESRFLQYKQVESHRQGHVLQQPSSDRQQHHDDTLSSALPFKQFITCYDKILSQALTQIDEHLRQQITVVKANMYSISTTSVLAWRKKVERLRVELVWAQACYTEAFVPVLNFLQLHRPKAYLKSRFG
jgi:hypothetical protein